ncbi:MAG: hypothetical protein IPM16_14230 [Chloroflexi bacterium]|nr:hypothetical protein [Chloroflexota bacterium]
MIRNRWPALALLVFTAISVMSTAAQPVPRAAPPNDFFSLAQSIALNTKVKITDVEQATLELNESVSCALNSDFSVWFTFTAPFDATISISTVGSQTILNSQITNPDTVLSVHTGNAAALVEEACNIQPAAVIGAQLPAFNIDSGVTYYVRVASVSNPISAGSFYKLTTRVIVVNDDYNPGLIDGGFEDGDPAWVLKNPSFGDSRVCGTAEAQFGLCAYKLIGGPGEVSKLQQTVDWPVSDLLGLVDQPLRTSAFISRSTVDVVLKYSLKIAYSDGTPSSKGKVTLSGSCGGICGGYGLVAYLTMFESPNVESVKITFKHTSPSGSALIDGVTLEYWGGVTRSLSGLLPVPAGG